MKRRTFVCLLVIISLTLWTGCFVQNKGSNESQTYKDVKNPMNLTFLGTSATGPGLLTMNGLAECVNRSFPDSVITILPGNLGTNVIRINNNEADVAMTDNVFVHAAITGSGPFNEKMDNITTITYLQPTSFQLITDSRLGIRTFDEIIQKRLKLRASLGLAGGAWPLYFDNLLNEYGLTIDDLKEWGWEIHYQGIDDSAQMLADNRIDLMIAGVFVPTPTIQELARNKEITLLKLDPVVMNNMCKKHGYSQSVITTNVYDFIREDIPCINTKAILIVPKDSSEENVYRIIKSIDENLDYLRTVHASFKNLSSETMVSELDSPLHPGAEKYYSEKGTMP